MNQERCSPMPNDGHKFDAGTEISKENVLSILFTRWNPNVYFAIVPIDRTPDTAKLQTAR